MKEKDPFEAISDEAMVEFISTMFAELNIGLLIYQLQDRNDPMTLKLLYANPMASAYTRTDLTEVIGQQICEAFPSLADTELPEHFAEVVRTGKAENLGAIEYAGDNRIRRGFFSVKAFPINATMMGVVFENVSLQKQLHDLVKRQIGK